jgi:hypothetical protein
MDDEVLTAEELNVFLSGNLRETMPAKATVSTSYFTVSGANEISERTPGRGHDDRLGTRTSTSYGDLTVEDDDGSFSVAGPRVTVNVHEDSEQVDVTLQWAGGVTSAHRLRRPVARYDQLSTYPDLLAHIDGLR